MCGGVAMAPTNNAPGLRKRPGHMAQRRTVGVDLLRVHPVKLKAAKARDAVAARWAGELRVRSAKATEAHTWCKDRLTAPTSCVFGPRKRKTGQGTECSDGPVAPTTCVRQAAAEANEAFLGLASPRDRAGWGGPSSLLAVHL
eukprot:jgi/Tetstr1/455390/TSEL_042222.t1